MHGTIGETRVSKAIRILPGVRHFLSQQKDGVAAIEFAVILPIFVVMMCGVINFGYAIYVKHTMQRIAGETMRAVTYGELPTEDAQAFARAKMEDSFGAFEEDELNPTVQISAGGDEVTVDISVATDRFDLVEIPRITVSSYAETLDVILTGKVITRFNPSI
ncbi:TadE/TadG family type IV pilus assembly protein [Hoeflea poritis]|uniref:Pilus assembly protein n=1 Tax=Hoeflea poritis TaxID=2993659 RepID=A0ABT4VW45_9HYPH|nr:TadE/TadG family type IV pilus assembly protein [Hoeflea poritis]MDA4848859.1 pilus assembly protein [Hoeflea poritis]